ncbi:hypothetical protein E2562_030254 [Oryza meyeriana var. granulata]|uniref:Uncharacterized protein n=1 Tax=Oryza meyeriana var. granulata TaxID=110450 RepID=A0A6G1D9A6_9ORYZ|nr:hypothetical protein E2562_030254 [Oryza meyeriana var. granulata]
MVFNRGAGSEGGSSSSTTRGACSETGSDAAPHHAPPPRACSETVSCAPLGLLAVDGVYRRL